MAGTVGRETDMKKTNINWIGATTLLAILLGATPVVALDTGGNDTTAATTTTTPTAAPTPTKVAAPTLDMARADIAASDWTKAIADLKLIIKADPKSADAFNLLGFTYRNHGDLKLAEAAYDRALKLNPNHTGALSYQGVLYVKLGKLDEAKANLAKIEKLCGNTTCAEYVELSKAIG